MVSQFTQLVDRNARSRVVDANFEPESGFGQILVFVEMVWEAEKLILAVVEPYDTQPWINVQDAPMLLMRPRGLQIVDAKGIIAPLGRIALEKGKRYVAFETSMGGIRPEWVQENE